MAHRVLSRPLRSFTAALWIVGSACGADEQSVVSGPGTESSAGTSSASTSSAGTGGGPTTGDSADTSGFGSTGDPADTTAAVDTTGASCGAHTIFLNRMGGLWTAGATSSVDNTTDFPIGDPLSPFAVDDAVWAEITGCVRGLLDGLDVEVTDVDPGNVDHIEIALTADAADQHGFSGLFAVALPTCELQPRGVAFVFVGSMDDPSVERICTDAIGFTVGVTAGLERSIGPCEVMSRLECADEEGKRFLDEEFLCGTDRTGPCFCGGALQNSWKTLVENFGACDQ